MNITTHNENHDLIDSVYWHGDAAAVIELPGNRISPVLGAPYWDEGSYPCWWISSDMSYFLVRQSFPEEIEHLSEEESWCVVSSDGDSARRLALHIVMQANSNGDHIKIAPVSKLKVGRATKLPLPDRRTA